ncbi:MAG: hypothetical protein JO232_19365 [Verrucomicrobia bacterium]|nr:hypothetical protein [Verrucomicrobiota bacterium]
MTTKRDLAQEQKAVDPEVRQKIQAGPFFAPPVPVVIATTSQPTQQSGRVVSILRSIESAIAA